MTTILLPTDFTEASEKALQVAIDLAKTSNCKIVVANFFYFPLPAFAVDNSDRNLINLREEEQSIKKLDEICERIQTNTNNSGKKLTCQKISREGLAEVEITSLIVDKKIDLIVMGTNTSNDISGIFGSTTLNVLENSSCPMLIIHKDSIIPSFKNIVVAMNKIKNDIFSLIKLVTLFRAVQPIITIVHVDSEKEAPALAETTQVHDEETSILVKAIKDYTSYSKLKYKKLFSKVIPERLIEYADNNKIDLLVIVKQERSWIENLFHKSVTTYIFRNCTVPLLILPNN